MTSRITQEMPVAVETSNNSFILLGARRAAPAPTTIGDDPTKNRLGATIIATLQSDILLRSDDFVMVRSNCSSICQQQCSRNCNNRCSKFRTPTLSTNGHIKRFHPVNFISCSIRWKTNWKRPAISHQQQINYKKIAELQNCRKQ